MAEAIDSLRHRSRELTLLVLRSLALIQVGLVVAAMIAPVTRTVHEAGEADEPIRPLSAPGLFQALTRVREPDELAGDQSYALIVSAVLVLALVGTAGVALLLAGSLEFPGHWPIVQYALAGIVLLATIALLPSVNDLRVTYVANDWYGLRSVGSAGKAAWGLWLPVAAAAWAISLARGVRKLAE